jgi:uncharacterized protein YutE (UPF0331/DUF86 family)
VLIHDYVGLDMERVVRAMDELKAVEEFMSIVARLESGG